MYVNPLYFLTPEESLRADNQIKLIKLELEYNVKVKDFAVSMDPEIVGDFLDSVLALEEIQKNQQFVTIYDKIGRPPFRFESELTNEEVTLALDKLLGQLYAYGISLAVLAPEDYDDRTIYRFVTKELLPYETTNIGAGWLTNFVYEEFHPNHRYDIERQCKELIDLFVGGQFEALPSSMDNRFFNRHLESWSLKPTCEVARHLNDLIESWWPYVLQSGEVTTVQIADDSESAEVTIALRLTRKGAWADRIQTGVVYLSQVYDYWTIERICFGDWVLE